MPAIIFIKADFPAPFSPMSTFTLPRYTSKDPDPEPWCRINLINGLAVQDHIGIIKHDAPLLTAPSGRPG